MKHRVVITFETPEHTQFEPDYDGSKPSIRDQLIVADATQGFLDNLPDRFENAIVSVYTAHYWQPEKMSVWAAPVVTREEIEARQADEESS